MKKENESRGKWQVSARYYSEGPGLAVKKLAGHERPKLRDDEKRSIAHLGSNGYGIAQE